MITVKRLTKVVEVVRLWPFFVEGFEGINRKAREDFDLDQMQKTLFLRATTNDTAWVGVAFEETEGKQNAVGFMIMEDATPLFSSFRSCISRAVYHRPGAVAIAPMMTAFEEWAKEAGFKYYVVTSRRHSGSAVRFFQSPKFGFHRGYITFEKEIK
jgi:hypothetical protein